MFSGPVSDHGSSLQEKPALVKSKSTVDEMSSAIQQIRAHGHTKSLVDAISQKLDADLQQRPVIVKKEVFPSFKDLHQRMQLQRVQEPEKDVVPPSSERINPFYAPQEGQTSEPLLKSILKKDRQPQWSKSQNSRKVRFQLSPASKPRQLLRQPSFPHRMPNFPYSSAQ